MGAAQSNGPRSVSMENPSGIIDVSDDVVQRLKNNISKQQAKENSTSPPAQPKKELPPNKEPVAAIKPTKSNVKPTPAIVRPPPIVYQTPPAGVFVQPGGQTITSADIHRQKELELQANDALWRERMAQLEKTLNKTNAIMEEEYTNAMDNVRQRFATAAPAHQLPPCQDLKAKIIACYRANPGETLKCNQEVALFRNCVSEHRVQKLDEEVAKPEKLQSETAAKAAKAG